MRRNQSSVIRTRNAVAFSSNWKCQRSMVISSTSLGTPVLGPRQYVSLAPLYSFGRLGVVFISPTEKVPVGDELPLFCY